MKRVYGLSLCKAAVVALVAVNIGRAVGSELDEWFRTPPIEARSRTWWHWQNGFLNADQMERELKFMREAGLGGCQQFVAGWTQIPTNGEHLVRFMSDEWLGFSRRALKAASDNGLEYGLQNGAGWSGVGGPWMTTEKSMKHVFAVERRTLGGKSVVLPPLGEGQYKEGGFVHDGYNTPWYGDIRSFAFPTPKAYVCGDLPRPRVSGVPSEGDLSWLLERNTFGYGGERKRPAFKFSANGKEMPNPSLRFDWDEKVTVRAVWLKGAKNTENAEVWASDDGVDFRFVAKLSNGYVSFEDTYAGRYHAIPKTVCRHIELRWNMRPCTLQIYEVGFLPRPTLTGLDDQCGRYSWNPFTHHKLAEEPDANLDPKDVIDITDHIAVDGMLEFTPPDDGREWTVLRIAATSTRRTNQPTNPDMAGPACDILDADAIRFHLSQYVGKMLEEEKAVGAHTIGNILLDSWEQGTANWSKCLPDEFRKRRGYDLAKYLPVFGGYFVGSRETSERFLWDFRKTITEVVKDNFFGVMSDYCRQHGLKHYVEGFACGSGTCSGDPLMAYFNCDVPMTERGPSVREASSAAHLKGGKLVAVEAHTSAADWSRTPRDFKRREDAHFRHGITRIIYHGGAHNPKQEWRFPGLTFGGYGAEIAPGQTWAKYMHTWQDYLARCQFMLRRGAFIADVLAFAGEDYVGQVVGVYEDGRCETGAADRDRMKGLPPGLDYDLVNAEFLKKLSVFDDGRIGYAGNPDATRYRALVLREQDFEVSVETARELKRLVNGGATVVGPKLVKSLGRPEAAKAADAEVAAIGGELAKSGRYLATIAELGLKPDFTAKNAVVARDVNYLHRREGETDIYYVVRWRRLGGDAQIGFKVTGKLPEIFDPLTGETYEADEFYVEDGYTYMPAIPCDAKEATRFVVFRKPTTETERTAHGRETRIAQLNPEWTIRFKDELGVDTTIVTNGLFDWSKHCDPAIATFSGTAVYRAKIALPSGILNSDVVLKLGQVEELCEVIVNGTLCGVAWCEPYEVKVPRSLIEDASALDLEIRVVNAWHNRLLADQQRPESERKTFTVRPPKADAKPVPSGLLGPLTLEF